MPQDWVQSFSETISNGVRSSMATDAVVGLLLFILGTALKPLLRALRAAFAKAHRSLTADIRMQNAVKAVYGKGIWTTRKPVLEERLILRRRSSKPIIALANLKGGVGKTTITANLGAALQANYGMRVLYVDLDFQGSLSTAVIEDYRPRLGQRSMASALVRGRITPEEIENLGLVGNKSYLPSSACLFAYYDLANTENQVMFDWLLERETKDIRFNIAELLCTDEVQKSFDVILIDTPPRLTTASIQALCASTHVLVPTVLDRLSGDAVSTFLNEVQLLKDTGLNEDLKVLGVVGSMTHDNLGVKDKPDEGLKSDEREGRRLIEVALSRFARDARLEPEQAPTLFPIETYVPRRTDIAGAVNEGLAYQKSVAAKGVFDRLADEVFERLKGIRDESSRSSQAA